MLAWPRSRNEKCKRNVLKCKKVALKLQMRSKKRLGRALSDYSNTQRLCCVIETFGLQQNEGYCLKKVLIKPNNHLEIVYNEHSFILNVIFKYFLEY